MSMLSRQKLADTIFAQFLTRILTKFLKGFYWPKRDEKMYKKVPIFRCTTPSTGKRLKEFEVVVGTLYSIMYQRRLQIPLISSLLMVLYTEISELFCTSFRLALVNKILLDTIFGCLGHNGHTWANLGQMYLYDFYKIFTICLNGYIIWKNAKKTGGHHVG